MTRRQHYTSIAHYEEGHRSAMCGCELERDDQGTVRLYQCALHEAAPALLTGLENFTTWHAEHFEDFMPEINAQLLCLANDAAAAIRAAKGKA